jgi:hypothetical protein
MCKTYKNKYQVVIMSSLIKLLTVVTVLIISTQTVSASGLDNSQSAFTKLQKQLWIQGISQLEPESDLDIEKKISDISELSASDFYPEELTQALNRI